MPPIPTFLAPTLPGALLSPLPPKKTSLSSRRALRHVLLKPRYQVTTQAVAAPHPRAPCPSTDSPSPASLPLRAERAVIVGGGPVGLVAALLLDQRGIRVTLLEKYSPDVPVDPTRAYNLVIKGRARRVMRTVPGLFDVVESACARGPDLRVLVINNKGDVMEGKRPSFNPNPIDPDLVAQRQALRKAIANMVKRCAGVDVVYGARVTAVEMRNDGRTEVKYVMEDGTAHSVDAKFVLGCDGNRSAVAAAMVKSSGKAEESMNCVGSATCVKSMNVPTHSARILVGSSYCADYDRHTSIVMNGNSFNAVFPAAPPESERQFVLALPKEHAIWDAKDVATVRNILKENFPCLNLTDILTDETVAGFVKRKPQQIGPLRRANEQGKRVGEDGSGGVIMLGDAAHSFPPSLAQGLNAGVEGVGVLAVALDECGLNATGGDVAQRFAELREKDVQGLVYSMVNGPPYAFGQYKGRNWWSTFKMRTLGILALKFPRLFYPPVALMVGQDLAYSEVQRRAMLTRRRVMLLLGAIAVALMVGIWGVAMKRL